MPQNLCPTCVFAIIKGERLDNFFPQRHPEKDGKGDFEEGRAWVTAKKHLDRAAKRGLRMPVVFADAAVDCSQLIYWALLDAITINDKSTHYRFSHLTQLGLHEHQTQDLTLESTGQPISDGFIRSYAICQTPQFLFEEP